MDQRQKSYTVRLYEPGDEKGIVKLLDNVFKPWPKFDIGCSLVEHWKWKFVDNPANQRAKTTDKLPHAVAVDGNEIIGIIHGMLYYTKVGDNTYLSQKGADVGVNNEYRGLGIFSKIDKQKEERMNEIDCFFGYSHTANQIILSSTNADNFEDFPQSIKNLIKIENVDKYIAQVHDEKQLNSQVLKAAIHGAKLLNRLTKTTPKPNKSDINLRLVEKFDTSIDTFYDKVKQNLSFVVEKTRDHLNWRYCDKRGGDYKTWLAEESGEILGFIVLRINKINPNYPIGYIIDLMALDNRNDAIEMLLKQAVEWFHDSQVNVIRAQLVEGHKYEDTLDRFGFIDSQSKPYLRYRPRASPEDLNIFKKAQPSALHYPYGEGDSI